MGVPNDVFCVLKVDAFRNPHGFGGAERSVMTAKERRDMSEEAPTEMKTTDVDAAKRFIVKNDQKRGYRLQCSFGTFHPTIYTTLRFPTRKSFFEALDEIDRQNRPSNYEYHHLPHEERIIVCDMLHDSNMRETICTFEVNISKYHGEVHVGISVEKNPVWDAMTTQWYNEREAKKKAEAEAAGICNEEEE
jgi:hypothetical protein